MEHFFEYFFNVPLFYAGSKPISLFWLGKLLLVFLSIIIFTGRFKLFLQRRLLVTLKLDAAIRQEIAILFSYGFAAIAIILIVDLSGFPLGSMGLLAGGLGVGIGLGLQENAKNIIGGITLLVERKQKPGDYVEFANLSGYIKEIYLRSTVIYTLDGADAIVPNSSLMENEVLNWNYLNSQGRMHLPVSVFINNDPLLVTEVLLQSAFSVPAVLQDPIPQVIFLGFNNQCFNFELLVWIDRFDKDQMDLVKSLLYYTIALNFRQRGITLLDYAILAVTPPASLQPSPLSPPESLIDLMKPVEYFQNCSEKELLYWLEIGYRKDLSLGEILYKEGEWVNFYILLSGSLQTSWEEGQKLYKSYQAGDFFGEFYLAQDIPSLFTVKSLEPSTLFVIPKKSFQALLSSRPPVATLLLEKVDQRLQAIEQKKQELSQLGLTISVQDQQTIRAWAEQHLKEFFNL
jgi:potassium efflux system protein